MGKDTDIQWCDSTINSTSGCDGCELKIPGKPGTCYSVPIHEGRLARRFPAKYAADFHEVRMIPGRMAQAASWGDLTGKPRHDKPWLDGMPRTIFVNDLGDLFSKAVTFDFIEQEVVRAATSPKGSRHIYMLLTKQPSRMAEFGRWLVDKGVPWPDNIWGGVSVTSVKTERRSEIGCYVPAKVKFLSVEPMLGPINFTPSVLRNYAFVIVGGESGPKARPFDLTWAYSIRKQCKAAGVAFFMKQIGSRPNCGRDGYGQLYEWKPKDSHGGDWDEWPEDLKVREFPRGSKPTVHA